MNTHMEGRNNHFFLVGLTHFIGFLILTIITMIYHYSESTYDNYRAYYNIYTITGFVISIVLFIFLYMAFRNLSSIMTLKSPEAGQTIAKMFLILLILMVFKLLSYAFLLIIQADSFSVVIVISFFSAIFGFLAYFFIWKFIQKQEINGMMKIVSYVFLIYSITTLFSGIFYGIYNLSTAPLVGGIQPLSYAFGALNSGISHVIAFIFILFSVKLVNQNNVIIVPKQIPETVIDQKQCNNCGSTLSDDVKFCVKCGTKIE